MNLPRNNHLYVRKLICSLKFNRLWWSESHSEGYLCPPLIWFHSLQSVECAWHCAQWISYTNYAFESSMCKTVAPEEVWRRISECQFLSLGPQKWWGWWGVIWLSTPHYQSVRLFTLTLSVWLSTQTPTVRVFIHTNTNNLCAYPLHTNSPCAYPLHTNCLCTYSY